MPNFTTGPATLPDVGELSYNGCMFSPLFETQVSGVFVKDAANRTTKEIEYTITVDGYVTLPDGVANVESVLFVLERLLSAQGGALLYSGRGVKISVNTAGGDRDVAWGPVPEILDITPMGAGRSAKIKWTVKTRIPPRVPRSRHPFGPVLQFNYETTVSYDETGYSTMRLAGIVEIPLTRVTADSRVVLQTADTFRGEFPGQLLATIDLLRYRVTRRDFKVSRDKRTLEFDVEAQENSWMAMPPGITLARGNFTFRPAKAGMGLVNWLCTLSVTYTVPKTSPRRLAWLAFLALLRVRMNQGNISGFGGPPGGNQNPGLVGAAAFAAAPNVFLTGGNIAFFSRLFARPVLGAKGPARRVWLIDLNVNEGLHVDARTVAFSATWRLNTVFSEILVASGLWRKVPEQTENVWATSVRNISGAFSWLPNRIDPNADVIVDFGS